MPDTKAMTWFLERRFPDEWGRKDPEPIQQQATQSTVNIVIPDNTRGGIQVQEQTNSESNGSAKGIRDEDDIDAPTASFFMDDAIDAEYEEVEVVDISEEQFEQELAAAQEALAKMVAKAERTASGSEEMASPPKSQRTKKRTAA